MAEPEQDDLADALARMAAGDIAPSEHEPAPTPPPRVIKPVTNRPATVKPPVVMPKPTAPPAPIRARPVAPTLSSAPAPAARPPAPVVAPATTRKARPAAPTTRSVPVAGEQTPPGADGGQSTGLTADFNANLNDGQVIDDDDSVIVPAPDPSVFDYRPNKLTADARAKVLKQKNLNYLRTLIPILFTFGILLIGFASLKFLSGEDSMLSSMPIWIPGILIFGALVFFAFMAMCMVVVRKMLAQS